MDIAIPVSASTSIKTPWTSRLSSATSNLTGMPVDDPDPVFYENYACKSERNYTQYCNPEVDKMIDVATSDLNALHAAPVVDPFVGPTILDGVTSDMMNSE